LQTHDGCRLVSWWYKEASALFKKHGVPLRIVHHYCPTTLPSLRIIHSLCTSAFNHCLAHFLYESSPTNTNQSNLPKHLHTNLDPSITMTASIGALSTPIIAAIIVGGIAALLILITVTAYFCDLPANLRRKKAAKESGRKSPIMDEVDVEKGEPVVTVTEVNSQTSKSSKDTRAPSPVCQCEHPHPASPSITIQPPRLPPHAEVV
jgi:hypothetical protein